MPTSKDRDFDVAIIGAGILGTALAHTMGHQGRRVLLLERDWSEPDRIVGELLQPGGLASLTKLGLKDCLDGIDAIPVLGYEVIYHQQPVHIPYPENEHGKAPQGRSFHHGRFVNNLRRAAKATPNVKVIEATVKDLIKNEATGQVLGVVCRRKGESEDEHFFAALTVSADGYASNFRKHIVKKKIQVTSTFVGLELIDADMPRSFHGHVILGDNAPILAYQIGTHETRVLVDVRSKVPSSKMKEHLLSRADDMPESLRPSYIKAVQSADRYPSMPNSFLPPTTNSMPGFVVLGDALNMRHPLTGGGMTVAFNDVLLLKDLLSPEQVPDLLDTQEVLQTMSNFHWKRKATGGGSSVINILSMALYSLFAADDAQLRALQRGCFEYFQIGGECVAGPCGLLAGIIRQPMVLVYHFFAVAIYAIGLMFRELSPLLWPVGIIDTVKIFWKACVVIFPYIWSEFRS